jgi:hypothetical protein
VMGSFERGDELSGSMQCEKLLPSWGTISFAGHYSMELLVVSSCVVHALQLACRTKETHQTPIKKS